MNHPAENQTRERFLILASLLVLGIYSLRPMRRAMHAYFTLDDAGNLLHMHKYWENTLAGMLVSAISVVSKSYRPLGGIYYFVLYKAAGFNPVPFRAVCVVLILVNTLLAFGLIRVLSGSTIAALIGALLIANHPANAPLLSNSGTIYEILCFFFYYLTIYCYFYWRRRGELNWRHIAVILALTGLALDSKEMAMSLPAALLMLEFIYFPQQGRWWRTVRGVLPATALVVAAVAVKAFSKNPLSDDPVYFAQTFRGAVRAARGFFDFLLYGSLFSPRLSSVRLVLLLLALAALATLLRSRPMKFGLCLLVVSLLPVCLIGRLASYMLYLPLLGWGLFVGTALDRFIGAFGKLRLNPKLTLATQYVVAILVIVTIARWNVTRLMAWTAAIQQPQGQNRRVIESLRKIHPSLPRGSSLLLLDDPLPADWELVFLAQMAYADPTLTVDRAKMLDTSPARDQYDYVIAGGYDLHDVCGKKVSRC